MSFTWDPERRKFINANGHIVTSTELRAWVESMTVSSGLGFTTRALRVKSGTKEPAEWALEMHADVSSLHNVATITAGGGIGQMVDQFWRYAQEEINFHLGYLNNFASSVLSGQAPVDDTFVARNVLYAQAGFGTFENATALREMTAGMNLYRRVLKAGENCTDCIIAAGQGWQLQGHLPRIGDSVCRTRCRCHFIFKDGTVDDIGQLRLPPAIESRMFLPPKFQTL